MSNKHVLVTGAAGFIGSQLSRELIKENFTVVGIDNLNSYYDVSLKEARLGLLKHHSDFEFVKMDLTDKSGLNSLMKIRKFNYVVNLAAQAGVRYSLTNPQAYLDSNIQGFLNILESCRNNEIEHLVYASSSSVYGANKKMPFSVHHNVDHPLSLYAATKKSNELMAHTYSSLFDLPTTGLRFFTVYGPYGRPDMALFIFTKAILEGKPINVYNHGKMKRDFTFVDDIVKGIVKLLPKIPTGNSSWDGNNPDPSNSFCPYRVFNIGNNKPIELLKFIEVLERKIGKKAIKNFMPIQPGDVPATYADIDALENEIGFRPSTPIEEGIGRFVDWYLDYYKVEI